jgi:hypothetical protein
MIGPSEDRGLACAIVDNAIASLINHNKLLANAARIKQLEREVADLKGKIANTENPKNET